MYISIGEYVLFMLYSLSRVEFPCVTDKKKKSANCDGWTIDEFFAILLSDFDAGVRNGPHLTLSPRPASDPW